MFLFNRLFAKSHTIVLHILSSNGFHLRPVAQFTTEAKKFSCSVEAESRGKVINAKNLNELLSLNLDKGDHFDLICRGTDADKAIEKLSQVFEALMEKEPEYNTIKETRNHYDGTHLNGKIIVSGVTISSLWYYSKTTTKKITGTVFSEAITMSIAELEYLYITHQAQADNTIYLAQKVLLESLAHINSLHDFEKYIIQKSEALHGGKMEAKIVDYQDILQRVKRHLGYHTTINYPSNTFILVAEDLLPSQIEALPKQVQGVVLKNTSPASHTAILLRATGIPSLIIQENLPQIEESVILDAYSGTLVISPTKEDICKAQACISQEKETLNTANQKRFEKAVTSDGISVKILANITDVTSAKIAKNSGAEGIGLLRTEFLFKEKLPSFKEQQDIYKAIFNLFDDVTIRTLDVGGDKSLPYIDIPQENNPFLGIRGIRLLKTHPELIEAQLHAIFIAAEGKVLKVMFPMIATVKEFNEAKHFAQKIAKKYHINIDNIMFGIMVEIPSVLFQIEAFNEIVDFYSIGTNDLNQYLFAIERTHPLLTLDPYSQVLFDTIKKIHKEADKPISICGEIASDSKVVPWLITHGITTLSLSAQKIPTIKETIRHV
ncbi:MAG: HPr family phosphocarrier protein [Sulfurovum sp.]|nr:HPr family phosphocarrier protein [Sulfurovum sp.]